MKMWRKWIGHRWLMGMQNKNHWKKSRTVSYKNKHVFPIQPSNCSLGDLAQRNENSCSHKDLHMNVHSSCINHDPKLKTNPMSFNGWIAKLWYIHTMKYYWARKRKTIDMQQPGWISKALCWVKKVNPKKLHSLWFHLYHIAERTKLERWWIDQWLPEVGAWR